MVALTLDEASKLENRVTFALPREELVQYRLRPRHPYPMVTPGDFVETLDGQSYGRWAGARCGVAWVVWPGSPPGTWESMMVRLRRLAERHGVTEAPRK